jgi:hypothetical protein
MKSEQLKITWSDHELTRHVTLIEYLLCFGPSKLVQYVTSQTCIREIPGPNLGPDNHYPDWDCNCFSYSLWVNIRREFSNRLRRLPHQTNHTFTLFNVKLTLLLIQRRLITYDISILYILNSNKVAQWTTMSRFLWSCPDARFVLYFYPLKIFVL